MLSQSTPPGTICDTTDSGFIDTRVFSEYLDHIQKHTHCTESKPIVLVADNLSSHNPPSVIQKAQSLGMYMVLLPPNSTHITQPLDVSVFGPFKAAWGEAISALTLAQPDWKLDSHTFSAVFTQPYNNSFTKTNIQAGFKCTGIYALNRQAISDVHLFVTDIDSASKLKANIPPHLSTLLPIPILPTKSIKPQFVDYPHIADSQQIQDHIKQKSGQQKHKRKTVYMLYYT